MTTNDIPAIRKLADAATDGPWEHGGNDGLVWPPRIGDPVSGSTETEDADFIAAARTHVPNLCDEVEQLRAELAANEGSEDARLTIAERKVEQLRAELAKAAEQNTAAWTALNKAGFQSPMAGIAELIDELAAALADAEGRGTALAALLTKSREQAAKVHEQNAAAQNALRSLGQAYADLKTDNDELAAENARVRQDRDTKADIAKNRAGIITDLGAALNRADQRANAHAAVVEAAKAWRAERESVRVGSGTVLALSDLLTALSDAVDALPKAEATR